MKKIAFTIAFGDKKYTKMARSLEQSIAKHSPNVKFIVFKEGDFTPYSEGLPKGRELYPKDYKYPKVEILTTLKDPNTKYMFIDADAIVCGDISPYFDLVNEGELLVEYVENKSGYWADVPGLNFQKACSDAGLEGIKPHSINSGFMIWSGEMDCFKMALKLIKEVNIRDPKGLKGDEYYFCAAMQLSKTKIKPLDYSVVKLGKFWNGITKLKKGQLVNTAYPEDDRIIVHYGNHNYLNPCIRKVLQGYGVEKLSLREILSFSIMQLKFRIKLILK